MSRQPSCRRSPGCGGAREPTFDAETSGFLERPEVGPLLLPVRPLFFASTTEHGVVRPGGVAAVLPVSGPEAGNEGLPGRGTRGCRGGERGLLGAGDGGLPGPASLDWSRGRTQPKSATLCPRGYPFLGATVPWRSEAASSVSHPLNSCARHGAGPCGCSDEQGRRGPESGVAGAWSSAKCR